MSPLPTRSSVPAARVIFNWGRKLSGSGKVGTNKNLRPPDLGGEDVTGAIAMDANGYDSGLFCVVRIGLASPPTQFFLLSAGFGIDYCNEKRGGELMSTLAAPRGVLAPAKKRTANFAAKVLASTAILAVAAGFVLKYVFRYYLNYNQAAFTDPLRGAANYWTMRGWLLMHMTGGMVALLTGPWQFWSGFRARYARLHRWTGRLFLGGVGVGCVGAFQMAINTTLGWAAGV